MPHFLNIDKVMYIDKFFKTFYSYTKSELPNTILDFLANADLLKSFFLQLDPKLANNYLYHHFIFWLSTYSRERRPALVSFLYEQNNSDIICTDFITFCFSKKITMNAEKTLNSFYYHNKLSDEQVKQRLKNISKKETIKLLGFGLDEGVYEKELAQFLINEGLCKKVSIYGLDPYAQKTNNIHYLTLKELNSRSEVNFDIIIARWSLHHVKLKSRWNGLIQCINRCNSNAAVLLIEHGILYEKIPSINENLYTLLNAIFDIVANIGLRPNYLIQTEPKGPPFFIRYLRAEDFTTIINNLSKMVISQKIYNVGPYFPNQTLYEFIIK